MFFENENIESLKRKLQNAQQNFEETNSSVALQAYYDLYDEYLNATNQYAFGINQYNRLCDMSKGKYDEYVERVDIFNKYVENQNEIYETWKGKIRDRDTVETEIKEIRREIKKTKKSGKSTRELEQKKEQLEYECHWSKCFSYWALQDNDDFEEKSQYHYTGHNVGLYECINKNRLAQAQFNSKGSDHSYLFDLPDDVVKLFNYIYDTQGYDNAKEYLDLVVEKKYTIGDALAYGFYEGTGLASLVTGIVGLIDEDSDYGERLDKKIAAIYSQHKIAYYIGQLGGSATTIALTTLATSGAGFLSGLPKFAADVLKTAISIGGYRALQDFGDVATGKISAIQYAKNIVIDAAAGGLGGYVGGKIRQFAPSVLKCLKLEKNTLANAVTAGICIVSGSASKSGFRELARYLKYPEGYDPKDNRIVMDMLVDFALLALESLIRAGITKSNSNKVVPGGNSEYESPYFSKDMSREEAKNAYKELAKQYHPDKYAGAADGELQSKMGDTMAKINADYAAWTKLFTKHIDTAAKGYQAATTSFGGASETAMKQFSSEVEYFKALVQNNVLSHSSVREAVEILEAARNYIASVGSEKPPTSGNLPSIIPKNGADTGSGNVLSDPDPNIQLIEGSIDEPTLTEQEIGDSLLADEGIRWGDRQNSIENSGKAPYDVDEAFDSPGGSYKGYSFKQVPSYLKVIDGKVEGKIPVADYYRLRALSIKNPDSEDGFMTLGRFAKDATSYTKRAGSSVYFDMGNEWNMTKDKYHITDDIMFEYFNKPGIDFAAETGRGFRFSHDPILDTKSALYNEWKYLQEKYGYTKLDWKGDFWYAVKE